MEFEANDLVKFSQIQSSLGQFGFISGIYSDHNDTIGTFCLIQPLANREARLPRDFDEISHASLDELSPTEITQLTRSEFFRLLSRLMRRQ